MKHRNAIICGLLILIALVATLWAYPQLPAQIPIHWNYEGQVNGYGPRWVLFLLGPGLMAAAVGLFAVLPKLSPQRFEVGSFHSTYQYLMLVIVTLVGSIYAIVLWAAVSGPTDIRQSMLLVLAVFFALTGNVMGKVRRNFWIGIRTPWTLADERVWYATHRLAGKTMVLGAIACALAALAGLPFGACLSVLMLGLCVPAVYSLICYKRLEQTGGSQ